jgi:hypothetical protein
MVLNLGSREVRELILSMISFLETGGFGFLLIKNLIRG